MPPKPMFGNRPQMVSVVWASEVGRKLNTHAPAALTLTLGEAAPSAAPVMSQSPAMPVIGRAGASLMVAHVWPLSLPVLGGVRTEPTISVNPSAVLRHCGGSDPALDPMKLFVSGRKSCHVSVVGGPAGPVGPVGPWLPVAPVGP